MPRGTGQIREITIRWSLAVLWLVPMADPASAQVTSSSPVFIVNLSAIDRGFTIIRASTLDDALKEMAPSDPTANVENPGDRLDFLFTSCQPDPEGLPRPATPIVQRLYDCADCIAAYGESRFLTKRGDTVALIVLYDGDLIRDSRRIRAFFAEAPRDSELIATAKALRALVQQETQRLRTPAPTCIAFTHTLQHKRSHLKAVVTVAPGAGGGGNAVAEPSGESALKKPAGGAQPGRSAAAGAAESHESALVTLGPEERWFLSADFSISKASVGLGEEPTVADEHVKSKDFFIAVNFALADLLADRTGSLQRRSVWRELLLKGQLLPSKEPWTAWAVGVGLRGYRIRTILWNLDVVHPYVTVGRQSVEGQGKWRITAGLGFDPRSLQRGSN